MNISPAIEVESDYLDGLSPEIELYRFGESWLDSHYPLEEGSARRASLIGSFQTIFNKENSPYDENWDYETLNSFLNWTFEQDYEGYIAMKRNCIAGFTWGYRIEPERVEIEEKFPQKLSELETDIFDGRTLMMDEIGVMPDYRGEGLGKALESMLLEKADYRDDISRLIQRTQWSGQNIPKLQLDNTLNFQPFTYCEGRTEKPVLEEVEFVGKAGSDERIYLWKELEGETS